MTLQSVSFTYRPGSPYEWNPCSYYDLDYTSILNESRNSFEIAYEFSRQEISMSESTDLIATCTKWDWDLSIYHSTTVTEVLVFIMIMNGFLQGIGWMNF
jgi:hypothetical protein